MTALQEVVLTVLLQRPLESKPDPEMRKTAAPEGEAVIL